MNFLHKTTLDSIYLPTFLFSYDVVIYCFNRDQCDQIGQFLNVFGDKVFIKSSPNAWCIFGLKLKATLFM